MGSSPPAVVFRWPVSEYLRVIDERYRKEQQNSGAERKRRDVTHVTFFLLAVTILWTGLPLVKTVSDIIPLCVLIFTGFVSCGLFGPLLCLQVKVVREIRDLDKK